MDSETGRLDKAGCMRFFGTSYEVGSRCLGTKVQVVCDRTSLNTITLYGGELFPVQAKPVQIGSHVAAKPRLSDHPISVAGSSYRLLQAARKKHNGQNLTMLNSYWKLGDTDV